MRSICLTLLPALLAVTCGCGDKVQLAPASGKVLYNDQPLPFGSVMFQPAAGQPARGTIQADGTFELSTFDPGDGATVGPNLVRVTCFEIQNPNRPSGEEQGEPTLGRSLIPKEYNQYGTSGLEFDVPPEGDDEIVLRLSGPELALPAAAP